MAAGSVRVREFGDRHVPRDHSPEPVTEFPAPADTEVYNPETSIPA